MKTGYRVMQWVLGNWQTSGIVYETFEDAAEVAGSLVDMGLDYFAVRVVQCEVLKFRSLAEQLS